MIVTILQARMSSRRLPGKVLLPILGRPMLELHIERLRRVRRVDALVLATSTDPSDDPVAELGSRLGLGVYRGALDDVLDRYVQAARRAKATTVLRTTGDCPLADPALIDAMVDAHLSGRYDYTSNSHRPTFPDGLDADVIEMTALERAWREAALPSHREHVTLYFVEHPESFKTLHFRQPDDLSFLRWTVDHAEDFALIRTIYERLYPGNPAFTTADILALMESQPALKTANAMHIRNAGWQSAFEKDREWLKANRP